MENTNEKIKNNYNIENDIFENGMLEKKIIVYLVIFTILLVFFALFAIHDIRDRGIVKDTQTAGIVYPGNTVDNPENTPVVDNTDRFRILEGAKEWSELKELSIFSGFSNGHVVSDKIAPGISGTYNFTVENLGDYFMKYDINFSDDNPYKVNMKFKMKLNGEYVVGDENTWKDATDLTQKDRMLKYHSSDLYTIEWKWVDAENDTEVGETDGAYYTLKAKAFAEQQE